MRGGIGLTKYGESGRQCGYFRHDEQIRMLEEVTFDQRPKGNEE